MARRKSKNTISNEMYGWDFEDCSGGQKAAVTRKFEAQEDAAPATRAPARSVSAGLRVEVGRIGNGPMKAFVVSSGTTVQDLLDKAGLTLDKRKEGVVAQTTGRAAHLDDAVVSGEVYVIAPEIESA